VDNKKQKLNKAGNREANADMTRVNAASESLNTIQTQRRIHSGTYTEGHPIQYQLKESLIEKLKNL